MKLSLFIAGLLFSSSLFAQNQIKGTIVNQNNAPIDFAEIYLYDTNEQIIQHNFTNENGVFTLQDIEPNTYKLKVFNLNALQYDQTILVNQNQELDTIKINTNSTLNEVVIQANSKSFERKVDRNIFNVANSVYASNNTATDLLKLTPGIKVEEENIALIGKGNARVMINDQMIQLTGEALLSYLKTISSENIQSIEVITAPPSKYDAEGNSGLINIVLKEARQNAWSNQINAGFRGAHKGSWSLGNNFNYNKNRVSILAGVSGVTGYRQTNENMQIIYPDQVWKTSNIGTKRTNSFAGNLQFELKASDKTSLGIQYRGSTNTPNNKDKTHTDVNNLVDNLNKSINTIGKNKEDMNNQSLNIHLIHKLDTLGTKLNFDFDYFTYKNTKSRLFNTIEYDVNNIINNEHKAQSFGLQNIENYSAKIDIDHPLKWFKFSYGAKASFITTDNKTSFFNHTSGTPIEDLKQRDNFEYKENTQAVYVNGSKNFGERWQAQVGLRLENTQTTGHSKTYDIQDKVDYTKLFPSVYLAYAMNEDNNFSLSYNRRIGRPSYWELNPFRWYINEYSYSEGNPKLEPTFVDNVETSYTFKNKLTMSIGYSITKNSYSQYAIIDPQTNVQQFVRENIYDLAIFNANISYSFNKWKWLQSQNTVSVFHNHTTLIKKVDLEIVNGWGAYFATNNTIYLNANKTFQAQIDFWYQPTCNYTMYNVKSTSSLTIGAKYAMLDKKLNLSLLVNDIFKSSTMNVTTSTNGINQHYNVDYDPRYINIGLSYTFGNSTIKVKEHQGGNEEETRRK